MRLAFLEYAGQLSTLHIENKVNVLIILTNELNVIKIAS